MYINGEFVDNKNYINVENPYTHEIIAKISEADSKDIKNCLKHARNAQKEWEKTSLQDRKTILNEIADIITNNLKKLAEIETKEIGKPIKESLLVDIPLANSVFKYYASILEDLNSPIYINNNEINIIQYHPYGVVGIFLPYNVPMMIFAFNVASALAAGNAVIVKPSELGSLSILELAKHLNNLDLPKGLINIITGRGETTGALLASSDIDLISYTGSTKNFTQMYKNLNKPKKIINETSGINIALVFSDAQIDEAAENIIAASFMKQGQMCINTSICLIEDEIYDSFVRTLVEKTKKIKLGDPLSPLTGMGPLRSKKQLDNTIEQVKSLINKGGKIIIGGNSHKEKSNGYFYCPTIIEVNEIIYEELFNPLLMIKSFKRNEIQGYLENNPTGLVLQIWTKNIEYAKDIAFSAKYGNIWINSFAQMSQTTPFGGFKESGWGRVLGKWGLFEFLQPKNIGITFGKSKVSGWFG